MIHSNIYEKDNSQYLFKLRAHIVIIKMELLAQ